MNYLGEPLEEAVDSLIIQDFVRNLEQFRKETVEACDILHKAHPKLEFLLFISKVNTAINHSLMRE